MSDNVCKVRKCLFITHSDSYRDIGNKRRIANALESAGFLTVNPELVADEDLVTTIVSADIVVLFCGPALANLAHVSGGATAVVLKSASYLHEDISLWAKLAKGRSLSLKEVTARNNIILLSQLRSVLRASGADESIAGALRSDEVLTEEEVSALFQENLRRSPSPTEVVAHGNKGYSKFEDEIAVCTEAIRLKVRPLAYDIRNLSTTAVIPPNECDIELSAIVYFCSRGHIMYRSNLGRGHPNLSVVVDRITRRLVANAHGHFMHLTSPSARITGPLAMETTDWYFFALAIASEALANCSKDEIRVPEKMFYLANDYTGWNIGHDLSSMLFALESYMTLCERDPQAGNVQVVLCKETLERSPNTRTLIELFIPKERWFLAKGNCAYSFDRLVVPPCRYFDLLTPKGSDLQRAAFNRFLQAQNSVCPKDVSHIKNVILVKRESHSAARRSGIMPEWVIKAISDIWPGWYVVDPEVISMFEIAIILSGAERLILGNGAIAYAHLGFINPSAYVYSLFRDAMYGRCANGVSFDMVGDLCFEPTQWEALFTALRADRVTEMQKPATVVGAVLK